MLKLFTSRFSVFKQASPTIQCVSILGTLGPLDTLGSALAWHRFIPFRKPEQLTTGKGHSL